MPRKRAIGVASAALAVVLLAASAAAAPQRTESPAALYRFLAPLRPVAPGTGATGSFFGTATVDETTATLQWWISYERLPGRASSSHIHRVARGTVTSYLRLCPPPACRSDLTGVRRLPRSSWNALLTSIAQRKATVDIHGGASGAPMLRGPIRMISGAERGAGA
jgi:hypothetical protein